MDTSSCHGKIFLLFSSTLVLLLAALVIGAPSRALAKRNPAHARVKVFDVRKFGAVGDGKTENSKAFLDAWRQACQYKGAYRRRLYVPLGTYRLWPVVFEGPCAGLIIVTIKGVLKGPDDPSTFSLNHWITFQYIDGMRIHGGGTLDGQGHHAWPYNKCACSPLPISVRLNFVNNTIIKSISSVDSKNFHFNVFSCHNIEFRRVQIIAPDESPNTDGIHIGDSSRIKITDSQIKTGDDCVSIGPGSKDIEIVGVHCGPGHGFSVGSLGKYPNEADVTGLSVRQCTMTGSQNGVRIKTWASPLKSRAYNFSFHDITMRDVHSPIIIDQEYCPKGGCSAQAASNVQIEDILFSKIKGTSASQVAVDLICSPSVPCKNINLRDINLEYTGSKGPVKSICAHVRGNVRGVQKPSPCI
ncbi:exopolygalacturonase [Eucalyptus grandis]|uniref:Uncharacterized protein n=2 Tax=Eucalyptus grandis TaxID=71139 RepID=A0ACC3LFP9_EUCGR|nr:exopolygalacturonase [Eucalyptus grandis]KAK3437588.1 hypothetical protein EUGRSUZ_C02251 [Eucalyptus grandis]